MACLIRVDSVSPETLLRMLRNGGRLLTLEGKRYCRIDEVTWQEIDCPEIDDEDEWSRR